MSSWRQGCQVAQGESGYEPRHNRCDTLLDAFLNNASYLLPEWRVENNRMGWRYHICGAPPKRRAAAHWLQACATGRSVAQQCNVTCRPMRPLRSLPPLLPAVRTLLEFCAGKLHAKLLALPRGEGSCYVSDFRQIPVSARVLITGLRRQRCAVVGNSPTLQRAALGAEIDSHNVVMRFNFAPTRGYERHVGAKTTVRVMGRSWVWNESVMSTNHSRRRTRKQPLTIHRYNNPVYLDEDLKLNDGFPIATLEHYFARSAFLLGMHASKQAKLLKRNATPEERTELRRYRWGHERLSISSGFAGLLFAMHACSSVSLYGFDLAGTSPGHYFNDATEGIVAKLQELLALEPRRVKTLSVDPGIEGLSLSSKVEALSVERAKHAARAQVYRSWIEQQYKNATTSHPYILERGIVRILAERGCIRLGDAV